MSAVFCEDARRVGHNDATVARGFEVDIVDAGSIIGDELQLRPRERKKRLVNPVGYGRNKDGRRPHGRRKLIPADGIVGRVQRHVDNSRMRASTSSGNLRVTTTFTFCEFIGCPEWPARPLSIFAT